jgi:hypothetical protein
MATMMAKVGFHDAALTADTGRIFFGHWDTQFDYTFYNFFHPFVGELIAKLNRASLPGMMDATWQESLKHDFFEALYHPTNTSFVQLEYFPKEIDVAEYGPYSNYNWELFFFIPMTIGVHQSKSRRFAEAQHWFHYVFNPTSNDRTPDPRARFWKFLAFRSPRGMQIDEILRLLSTPKAKLTAADQEIQQQVLRGYTAILNNPFQPHRVARTRHLAYQYWVVMKYLDNLIAWGDDLFQQDTVESINEATQRYVLAANLLGPKPQRIPPQGAVQPKTFKQLKQDGLGPIGDALVELEGQFPFNFAPPLSGSPIDGVDTSGTLFGIGRTLYFCLPPNDKMLSYWDTVADRLFKIRHCMNIQGVVRPLALFDPPLDPGMLVKAAAAGIDVSSIVNGLNQPIGPVRCLTLIQKALELCSEVRSLGGALLSCLEKRDGEHLALLRQAHEIKIQQMSQEVRFLQWQSAREATKSLLTNRGSALERLRYYQRQLGLPQDQNAPELLALDHRELTEENFDEAFNALVGQYDRQLAIQSFPELRIVGNTSPAQQSGATGQGRMYLNKNEDADLNQHGPAARDFRIAATVNDGIFGILGLLPDFGIKVQWWGIGGDFKFGGSTLSAVGRIISGSLNTKASDEDSRGGSASKSGSFERRADDWTLQYNAAAHELRQLGRQILTSLIAEQIAHHEYLNIQQQIRNAQEVDQFLHDKFTNEQLYLWMQGEISRLYYEYYRFAFDTARKAERTMKQELMRPELDAQDFVKFNYWDGGRKGLLSGEALHLDVKRMEMAYHENNKRELELIRHVSLRQLNPLALLTLKATGTCQVTIPEWLYDRDCPGHYMRRIKSVSLSMPSVVGPYTSVNCTLSLLRSSLRKSPLPKDGGYQRQGSEDDRFVDYIGAVQSIVTSSASNDSGMFETNLRDERFLPFEGAGAESTWKLDLAKPSDYPAFDYSTISDVILHVRYTARQGVEPGSVNEALNALFSDPPPQLALLFSLRHDFPTEWSAFVNSTAAFTATIRKDFFPYFTQGKTIHITNLELYAQDVSRHRPATTPAATTAAPFDLAVAQDSFAVNATPDATVLKRLQEAQVFLLIRYSI